MDVQKLTQADVDRYVSGAVDIRPGMSYPNVVLLCEHGRNSVPSAWNNLGISHAFFATHFGADLGAADLTIEVAQRLGATAIVSNYSRLFLDYNRHSNDPDCFKLDMGGIPIPGNLDLSAEEIALRDRIARTPVEKAVDRWTMFGGREPPLLISLHSFSPIWANQVRSCEIGVMWREDERLAPRLIEALKKFEDIDIGDNEPYDFRTSDWYTLKRHGLDANVPAAYIEVRNSYLIDETMRSRVSDLITRAIQECITARGKG